MSTNSTGRRIRRSWPILPHHRRGRTTGGWHSSIPRRQRRTRQPHSIVDPQKDSGPLHGLQIAVPRWSPDGSHVAFIGGLMSDQGATGGDVYLVASTGGNAVNLTPKPT